MKSRIKKLKKILNNKVGETLHKETLEEELIKIVLKNPFIQKILNTNPFPNNSHWYLGAGCVCQSVWNYLLNEVITKDIKDYDLVYYDRDISKKTELNEQLRVKKLFIDLPIDIEVTNEARVHVWYEEYAGKKIDQYKSCEDAIDTWPTTATAIGINKVKSKINVYAPYGLNDLFSLTVRANKLQITKDVYERKVEKWTKYWPVLRIIPWEKV